MSKTTFLDWAISLLEEIERSPEKKLWCHDYSVYSPNSDQEALKHNLSDFLHQAYEEGLVITNYMDVICQYELNEQDIITADKPWLESQPYMCVLACIAWHFRRDRFCEGSLISSSIADGIMLRLLRRLKSLSATVS